MKKTILVYGLLGGVLVTCLKLIEYRFLVVEHSLEIYGGLVALVFSTLGIWLGLKLTTPRDRTGAGAAPASTVREGNPAGPDAGAPAAAPSAPDAERADGLGITPRELEILRLIAAGLSNREIARRLFVSENTVKTHSSRVFAKLNARRRTQAVQLAKEAGILP